MTNPTNDAGETKKNIVDKAVAFCDRWKYWSLLFAVAAGLGGFLAPAALIGIPAVVSAVKGVKEDIFSLNKPKPSLSTQPKLSDDAQAGITTAESRTEEVSVSMRTMNENMNALERIIITIQRAIEESLGNSQREITTKTQDLLKSSDEIKVGTRSLCESLYEMAENMDETLQAPTNVHYVMQARHPSANNIVAENESHATSEGQQENQTFTNISRRLHRLKEQTTVLATNNANITMSALERIQQSLNTTKVNISSANRYTNTLDATLFGGTAQVAALNANANNVANPPVAEPVRVAQLAQ